MKRILVPLDGTDVAESILPDACRYAGKNGEMILVRDVTGLKRQYDFEAETSEDIVRQAELYLEAEADTLRVKGTRVRTQVVTIDNVASGIDEMANLFDVDMIACATHGRGPLGRLVRGSIAWKALAHSTVPVLLRHPREDEVEPPAAPEDGPRTIMVPLDGSPLAESALPLARELASEWNASTILTRVALYPFQATTMALQARELVHEADEYLQRVAQTIPGDVQATVLTGPVSESLSRAATLNGVTDIVMASHGRTGLTRVLLGSVADGLIHKLHCPIVVVPAGAVRTSAQPHRSVASAV